MAALKWKDTRFYGPTRRFTDSRSNCQYTLIEFRKPDPAEYHVLSSGTSYAYCRTDKLAKTLGQRDYDDYDFSQESGLVHEGAHGIISLAGEQLEDLFGEE